MRKRVELTLEQKQYLIENYAKTNNEVLMDYLGISKPIFYREAKKLGLSKHKKIEDKWSKRTIEYVKTNYGVIPNKKIESKLGISKTELYRMLNYIGVDKSLRSEWDDESIATLYEYYGIISVKELSKKLGGKSINSIYSRVCKEGLQQRVKTGYSDEEWSYLRDSYLKGVPIVTISERLHKRSESSIRVKLSHKGVRRYRRCG